MSAQMRRTLPAILGLLLLGLGFVLGRMSARDEIAYVTDRWANCQSQYQTVYETLIGCCGVWSRQ